MKWHRQVTQWAKEEMKVSDQAKLTLDLVADWSIYFDSLMDTQWTAQTRRKKIWFIIKALWKRRRSEHVRLRLRS